ncbi:MAG: type II toxin-antitoxin system HigB family toxin [Planctomycetes bacterium]|nr:type II toxin-antitoxin system HigB family toxin [Planctomycetota bacterium]
MHIIARPKITEAIRLYPDAAKWLQNWWKVAGGARWNSLREIRSAYQATDQVYCCLIFNVRGNRYRLICRVTYANEWQRGTLLVKHFLTHAEYDKDYWKRDCR